MLISKEQFIQSLSQLKASYDEMDKFSEAISPYFSSVHETPLGEGAREALNDLLVVCCECQEEDDIFFWWLFDNCEKVIEVEMQPGGDSETYDVSTPEGLYEYLYDRYHRDK